MKTKRISHPVKMIFALVAMVSLTVMTGCSSDNIDPNKELVPAAKPNKIIVDGNEVGVEGVMMNANTTHYLISFSPLTENAAVYTVTLKADCADTTIDLTKQRVTADPKWTIIHNIANALSFSASEIALTPACTSGQMRVDVDKENKKFHIVINNLRIKATGMFGDGNEHSLSVNFEGIIQ